MADPTPIRSPDALAQLDRVRGLPAGHTSPDAIVTAPATEPRWRVGSFGSGGLAIYEGTRRVCLIKSREDADRIVAALNREDRTDCGQGGAT